MLFAQAESLFLHACERPGNHVRRFFRQPIDDVLACLEPIVTVKNPVKVLVPLFVSLIVNWVIYVPIHELLHAFGCWVTGGTVTRLEIQPHYGGSLLAKVFPWVVSGSEYAGRLSGFETFGSDLVYLATDFAPFVLSVILGVPLLKLCKGRRRPILFPMGIVLGLAPFYNLPGDYFEMASIITTRASTPLARPLNPSAADALETPCPENQGSPTAGFRCLRCDDVFKLIGTYCTKPAELHLRKTGEMLAAAGIILASLAVALLLAFATYALGSAFSRLILGSNRRPSLASTAPPRRGPPAP